MMTMMIVINKGALWPPKWHAKVEYRNMELRRYTAYSAIYLGRVEPLEVRGMHWSPYVARLLGDAGDPSSRTAIGVAALGVSA